MESAQRWPNTLIMVEPRLRVPALFIDPHAIFHLDQCSAFHMEEAVDNNPQILLLHNIPNSSSRVERTAVVANLILSQIHSAIKVDLKAI